VILLVLGEISSAIDDLDNDVVAVLGEDNMASTVRLLHEIRTERQRLAIIEAQVEAECARRMPDKVFRGDGLVAERKGGAKRVAWRHDDLAWAVVNRHVVDGNGEVDPVAAELVGKIRDDLLNAAAISYWRTTQLRLLGIDPGDYSTTEVGRRTVHVHPELEDDQAAAS
jgi:hypothetical protein